MNERMQIPNNTAVIYHSAGFDGVFCREIARKFLGEARFIGWNFVDPPIQAEVGADRHLHLIQDGKFLGWFTVLYVLDLPVDQPLGKRFQGDRFTDREIESFSDRIIWIDHHASSIASHPATIPGYRIDGVAACRLAWQWFLRPSTDCHPLASILPAKQDFVKRQVAEPLAVRLVGEYDVWDHRGDGDVELQFGLRATALDDEVWRRLLGGIDGAIVPALIEHGESAKFYADQLNAEHVKSASFLLHWEGLRWLALNTGGPANSLTFAAKDVPETGHDAILGFRWTGKAWMVGLYHASHRKELDLSKIAVRYGGGGHRGACGFTCSILPFVL